MVGVDALSGGAAPVSTCNHSLHFALTSKCYQGMTLKMGGSKQETNRCNIQ